MMVLCGDAWVFEEDVVCIEVAGWMGQVSRCYS